MIHLWLFGQPLWETIGEVLLVIFVAVCAILTAIVFYVGRIDLD